MEIFSNIITKNTHFLNVTPPIHKNPNGFRVSFFIYHFQAQSNLMCRKGNASQLEPVTGQRGEDFERQDTINKPEYIDPALSNRPIGFDSIFRIDYPDYECRLKMLEQHFRGLMCEDALRSLAEKTRKFSMAYLNEVCLLAAMMAANQGNGSIDHDDIFKALARLKQQILSSNKPFYLQNKPKVSVE